MGEKWYRFATERGYRQKRPPERKYVLVAVAPTNSLPVGVAVGYLKYAAGEKDSPFFVVPHFGHGESHRVIAWCDCLPDTLEFPKDAD